jgi:hypothetical protein
VVSRAGLLFVCLLALAVGGVGIGSEGRVSLYGDTPRYLMNGVYVHDVLRDRPFGSVSAFIEYTRLYYARYPALSLGHHPVLLPVLEAPAFAVLGISVWSGRIVMLLSLLAAVIYLYLLVSEIYGPLTGLAAAALLATSPLLVQLTQMVMSELPAMALLIACAYYVQRFCATERRAALVGFVVTAVAAMYAKQLTAFVIAAILLAAMVQLGWRRLLLRADTLVAGGAVVLLTLPLVPLTLKMSPTNVGFVMTAVSSGVGLGALLRLTLSEQLAAPVIALGTCGLVLAVSSRDRRALLFVLWTAAVLVILRIAGTADAPRSTIYWVPPIAVLAASLLAADYSRWMRFASVALVVAAFGVQLGAAAQQRVSGAGGYEEAAEYVVNADPGATVMFTGDIDTGFFTFFVRKHDPSRQLVVLRGDKVFTTSRLARPSIEDRIGSASEIYDILRKYGTRFMVIEDRPSRSRTLESVRAELRTSAFAERKRIPIDTTDRRLEGTDLVVYEFLGHTAPDPSAILDIRLPLVRQEVTVTMRDLLARKYLR